VVNLADKGNGLVAGSDLASTQVEIRFFVFIRACRIRKKFDLALFDGNAADFSFQPVVVDEFKNPIKMGLIERQDAAIPERQDDAALMGLKNTLDLPGGHEAFGLIEGNETGIDRV